LRREWLVELLGLKHGVPSHDTFSRVFRTIDPKSFGPVFQRFSAAFGKALRQGSGVAIDGKAVRGAFKKGQKTSPLHLVNVWSASARMAIAQVTAPNRNEVAGVLEALKLLRLDGAVVTADAMHARADVIEAIMGAGADYVIGVKKNQPTLLSAVTNRLETAKRRSQATQCDDRVHGRSERRHATVVRARDIGEKLGFPGLCAVASITTTCAVSGKEPWTQTRYFILSKPIRATRFLNLVRGHWQIENNLHWQLDVTLKEDANRARQDHAPENQAILRKIALALLAQRPEKISLRRKIKWAGWKNDFLLSLLGHMQ
jgi:predicted transposase YbfD/YdcC